MRPPRDRDHRMKTTTLEKNILKQRDSCSNSIQFAEEIGEREGGKKDIFDFLGSLIVPTRLSCRLQIEAILHLLCSQAPIVKKWFTDKKKNSNEAQYFRSLRVVCEQSLHYWYLGTEWTRACQIVVWVYF